MTDVERQLLLAEARMLKASIERLEAANAALMVEIAAVRSEYARAVVDNERLAGDNARLTEVSADQLADNSRLRAALRMVVDKGRAIPKAEADGTAGVLIVLQDNEWGFAVATLGGWQGAEPAEAAHP